MKIGFINQILHISHISSTICKVQMDVYEKIKNLHPEFAGLTGDKGGIWSKKEPDYDVYKKIGRLHPVFLINSGCKGTKKLYTSKFPLETG